MLTVLGAGKLGKSIISGLLRADPSVAVTLVVRPTSDRSPLQAMFPTVAVDDHIPSGSDVVLCVKPKDVAEATELLVGSGVQRVLSVAAGVSTERLSQLCGADVAIVRSMPNVASSVGASATAYCRGPNADDDDLLWASSVLSTLGEVVCVSESEMDAATGVSGSGIAFVLTMLEAMIAGGVASGLTPKGAHALALATLRGAAVLADGDEPIDELRARVVTPGGTTEAGLRVLEETQFSDAVQSAVQRAAARANEIGQSLR